MKNLLFTLSLLASTQLFAISNCKSDTIKISIINNEISIEADNTQELKELLKHDLNALLKNLNFSELNDSTNMELIVQNDSIEQIQISTTGSVSKDNKNIKKIISISKEGVFFKDSKNITMELLTNGNIHQEETTKKDAVIEKLEEYAEDWMKSESEEIDSTKRTFMMSEIHLGINNYLNEQDEIVAGEPYSLKSSLGSFAYVSYAKTQIFANGPLFLKYGLALTSNNYKYANNYVLTENKLETTLIESPNELVKSKLSTLFIDAPVLLQLDFSSDIRDENGFNIAVGPFVGYMLKAKTKINYIDENNNSNKEKQKGEYHLNKVRYGLQAQFGVMGFNFYGKYHLTSLFENNKGAEKLNVIDFGIVFDI